LADAGATDPDPALAARAFAFRLAVFFVAIVLTLLSVLTLVRRGY